MFLYLLCSILSFVYTFDCIDSPFKAVYEQMSSDGVLTCLNSFKLDVLFYAVCLFIGKQHSPRCDAAERGGLKNEIKKK